jgi:uncharacterized protein YjbI with pentapeptide repeats
VSKFTRVEILEKVGNGESFSGADLSDADLSDADLSDANLSGANLSEADLSEAKLCGANLSGANLNLAGLSDANLSGANLKGVYLRGAYLRGAYLRGANLGEADLNGADLSGANLNVADLSGAYLGDANLSEADLWEADLRGADLRGADLSGADLSGAVLSGANLSGADLSGADLIGTDFSEADLSGADLSGSNPIEANLIGANLIGANLSWAELSGAHLSGANLREADLSGADLREADLREADLSGADLSGANLSGANLIDSDLRSAMFEDANLEQADISGANIYYINTHGWRIYGIKCTHVYSHSSFVDEETKVKSLRKFELEKFEEIYTAMPMIEMIFSKGLSGLDFVKLHEIIKTINEKSPESSLKIRGLENYGFDWVVRLATQKDEYLEEITKRIVSLYKDRGLEERLLPIVKQLDGSVKSTGQQAVHHHYGDVFNAPVAFTTIESGGKRTNVPIGNEATINAYSCNYDKNRNEADDKFAELKKEISENQKELVDTLVAALKEKDNGKAQQVWEEVKEGIKTSNSAIGIGKALSSLLGFIF